MQFNLILMVLLAGFMQISIAGIAQEITVHAHNIKASQLFKEIKKQTGYLVVYDDKELRELQVSIDAKQVPLNEVLDQVLAGHPYRYTVVDRNIFIKADPSANAAAKPTYLQQREIRGHVRDSDGNPLANVTVRLVAGGASAKTDEEGNFSIRVSEANPQLIFSSIGYETLSVSATSDVLGVVLQDAVSGLDEVVVVGYGSQRKADITGSVVSVKAEDFNQGALFSPMQLIQGKVAGLMVNNGGGTDPNSSFKFQLRGISSVTGGAEPLIVIDGIPTDDINVVAPEDIESMDILKDGAAAAIYGTRGNNGVILITTKKGQSSARNSLSYSSYVSTESIANRPDVLSASEYRAYSAESGRSISDLGSDTDWFEELVRTPVNHSHNLSLANSNEQTSYRFSLNYRDLQGVVINTDRQLLNGRINFDHRMFENKLRFQVNASNTMDEGRMADYQAFEQAMWLNPTAPIRETSGAYWQPAGFSEFNPVARLEQNQDTYKNSAFIGSFRGIYDIYDGLSVSVVGAIERKTNNLSFWESIASKGSIDDGYSGLARKGSEQFSNRTLETVLNYDKQWEDHRLNLVGGYSYQDFEYAANNMENRGFLTDAFGSDNIGAGDYLLEGKALLGSVRTQSRLVSFFGRANYSYLNRYLASVSLRHEGSTKFGDNNKWGNFPAVSLGWRISEEAFLRDAGVFDDLKLRVGYGITGNQDIDPYLSLIKLNAFSGYPWNGGYVITYAPSSNPNPDLRWERKAETNIGLDAVFARGRVNASVDVYRRVTSDLLYLSQVQVPSAIFTTTYTNIGEIKNEGIEFVVGALAVDRPDFKWSLDLNASYNRNELVSLAAGQNYADRYEFPVPGGLGSAIRMEAGQPLGNFYGKEFDRFTPEGQWVFKDHAGDGENIVTENDKTIIGNGMPDYFVSFNNRFAYKQFDLNIFFRGVLGFDIVNAKDIYYGNKSFFPVNVLKKALDSPLNAERSYSSYYVEKGDYLKLDNVTLGYNFKLDANRTKLRNVRAYVSANNLLTITGYSGLDPEVELTGLEPGIDTREFYPKVRTFTFGVHVGF